MRYLIIIVAFLTAAQAVEVDNPQARRALDNFTTATSQANERMEAEIRAATVRHNAAIEAATARAVRDVAGLINTRLGPAEQATLYRVLLALDPQHRDARQFFSAVGTLDTVLEEVEPLRHQLLGTIPAAGEKAASPAVAAQEDPFTAPIEGRVYLSDLPETSASVGWGRLGKNGDMGYDGRRMLVGGKEARKGLSTHPPANGEASVTYNLGRHSFNTFTAVAATHDHSRALVTPLVFQVWGDGKLLRELPALTVRGESSPVSVRITGVSVLELRVVCRGRFDNAMAIWAYPELRR